MPDPAALLLAALLGAEVAAVGLVIFHEARSAGWPKIKGDWRLIARKRAELFRQIFCRPLVLLLTFALVDELLQLALHAWLDTAPRPLAGWHRAGWHVSIALSLGWPVGLAWAAHAQKTNAPGHQGDSSTRLGLPLRDHASNIVRTPGQAVNGSSRTHPLDPLLAAYLGLLAGLAIVYPPSRAGLRWTLLVWELACVAVAWWGIWRRRAVVWGAAEHVLVVLVSCETMVCVVGPFASDPFTRWWIARAFYLGAWGACCGVLIKRRT